MLHEVLMSLRSSTEYEIAALPPPHDYFLDAIGVGNGSRRPRPPNRACGFPAHGSPVGSFLIGIGSPTHGP
jgi:hypothetical protein